MRGNWNVRHATSQQVFKVTTFCTDTCFQSFLPLIICIVHHALLKFSPCRNTLPQLVRIADWYSIHALLQHAPDAVIYRVDARTVGWPHVRTDELGCLTAQKLDCVMSMMWCAGQHCWKTNTSPAMLRIAGSNVTFNHTQKFCIFKVVRSHFSGVVAKGVTVCFLL